MKWMGKRFLDGHLRLVLTGGFSLKPSTDKAGLANYFIGKS